MWLVADNLQMTHPRIASALRDRNPEPIRERVRRLAAAGADAIDINTGPLPRDAEEIMTFLVSTVRSVTDLPIFLDTTNPKAMEAGLRAVHGQAVVNGVSLDPARLSHMLPLVRETSADLVCFLMREDHTLPVSATDRLSVAVELFQRVTEAGVQPERLIIDPVVAPLLWADGKERNLSLLEVIRQLPEVLGMPVRTMAGLSNLTTGFTASEQIRKEKRMVEGAFVSMLAGAGLSMALMNMDLSGVVAAAKASRMLYMPGPFAWGAMGL